MALSLGTLVKAHEQRERRKAREGRQKFLYEEYFKFEDIKEFAEYFKMDVDKAIWEITQGRELTEAGL